MERFTDILQPHIQASQIRLSYVEELFVDLKDNPYIILHRNNSEIKSFNHDNIEESSDECLTKHDSFLSGSPLEYSFDNYKFEDTITIKQTWQKQEESYLPLSRNDACNALNMCLERLDNNTLPILALCDGKDLKQSRLIGAIIHENWFTTLEAVFTGVTTLTTLKKEHQKIIQEHLKRSFVPEQNIKTTMFNTFDLFGIKQEIIDWDKTTKSDFKGSINIEIHSDKLVINPRLSKNTLIIQVNAGWKNSFLKELKCQLLLLDQYLSIIDEYQTMDEYKKLYEMEKTVKFSTPYSEEHNVTMEELNLLLSGDFNFKRLDKRDKKGIDHINEDINIDAKLKERVQNVFLRDNIDFTDYLWEILIKSSEYSQIVKYIRKILHKICNQEFIPQVNDTNSTRFIKFISNHYHQDLRILTTSEPLEFVVDMGFEKLTRDYLYILGGARFVDLYDVKQKLIDISSGIFSIENYRKTLVTLAQFHLCLECMLLIEEHLEYPIESLQSLFTYVYKEFVSAQSPLQSCIDLCNQIFTLMMPLPYTLIKKLNKMNPSICRTSISSQSAASKLTTTTYYSKTPIFPTNIYPIDNENTQDEIVYGINATSSSARYKKI